MNEYASVVTCPRPSLAPTILEKDVEKRYASMGYTRPFPTPAAHPMKKRSRFEGPRSHIKLKTSGMVAIGLGVFFLLRFTSREASDAALMMSVFGIASFMIDANHTISFEPEISSLVHFDGIKRHHLYRYRIVALVFEV
jgi:hypothetical protein